MTIIAAIAAVICCIALGYLTAVSIGQPLLGGVWVLMAIAVVAGMVQTITSREDL